MPSTFLGLNTGLSGLSYFQNALNTTSHNISNANSTGYSKQVVSSKASNPLDLTQSYGMMGTGVTTNGIMRERDQFYDVKYYSANEKYNLYASMYDNLSELQTYMNEMASDSGYTKWLSKMNDALQDLSANPSDYTTRISFTLTADSFTDVINELGTNFQNTQKSINDEIELAVSDINSISKQIYDLSLQIQNVELKGGNANDLRDKRDNCLDQLSEYGLLSVTETNMMFGAGVGAVEADATTMSVFLNGSLLVDQMGYHELMVVPREQGINQNDIEGLVDIHWKNSDGTAGEEFNVTKYTGRLTGLVNVRDGNNCENVQGTVVELVEDVPASVTVKVDNPQPIEKCNVPNQGTIILNGKKYLYDGWEATYDKNGNLDNFKFKNMTMMNEKNVQVKAEFPKEANGDSKILGHPASMGEAIDVKGIPYYMARFNELVRTFSEYMNSYTTAGVDAEGNPGLDAFTAEMVPGENFVLKDSVDYSEGKVLNSMDQSYYRLTALNWELNNDWKDDPSKVVVSYADDIEQGDLERRPIVDAIMYGMTDMSMFEQGTIAQYLQSVTTNLAVDISKDEIFSKNQEDIRYTIDNQRKSISGVDQNEEASDLVKFQQLYNLASKVISILNEVYDRLITQTGV